MASISEEIKKIYKQGGYEIRFIFFNVAVFLFIKLVELYLYLYNKSGDLDLLVRELKLPADLNRLAETFWTPLSYQFLHVDFLHILFNMLVLYWFGKIFTSFIGNKRFPWVYILSGLSGGLFYVLAYNLFPIFEKNIAIATVLGASASVMGIMFAAAAYAPDLNIRMFLFGTVKLKYIALIMAVVDLITITDSNPGGHIAHLGGAVFGFMYGLSIKPKGIFFSFWIQVQKFFTIKKRKPRMKVSYKKTVSDDEYNKQRAQKQKRTDTILDKISQQGYESLTKEEKEFLFKQGKDKK
ncbi:MAG: rhomboid family intramembrane serine protease [Bacteroidota bacterium]